MERRWLPWKPRRRRITRDDILEHGLNFVGGDDLAGLAFGVVLLIVLVALPIIVVLMVLFAEVLIVLAVLPLLLLGRAVLVGTWPIDVRREGIVQYSTAARGWARSRERLGEIASALALGRTDPPGRHAG